MQYYGLPYSEFPLFIKRSLIGAPKKCLFGHKLFNRTVLLCLWPEFLKNINGLFIFGEVANPKPTALLKADPSHRYLFKNFVTHILLQFHWALNPLFQPLDKVNKRCSTETCSAICCFTVQLSYACGCYHWGTPVVSLFLGKHVAPQLFNLLN